jgi:heterodisulfide reductase subunit A
VLKVSDSSTGVFICCCGDNISGTVDIKHLKESLSREKVACVEEYPYLCSIQGQELIKNKITDINLDNVVIAACSPKLHEKKFQKCIESAGINKYLLDMPNIREQAAWVKKDPDPTKRALAHIKSSIKAVKKASPRETTRISVIKSVLVIGGGISGITAALSLAKQNIKVHLVEKNPTIGGNMVKIGKVFSAEDLSEECSLCSLAPLMGEVAENENIELLTLSQVTEVQGMAGNFKIKVSTGPVLVDPEKCTSCGYCSPVCPVNVPDEWNDNLSTHKAIYKPFSQSVLSTYTIDTESCTSCGACLKACSAGAINLGNPVEEHEIDVGAIVVATGHVEMKPYHLNELGYGKLSGVMTQTELARLLAVNGPTSGKLVDINTGQIPKRMVMIQCVGSRDRKPGNIPHCSTICCMTALKHASYISDHFPDVEIFICYTDLRTPGTYENYYFETQKKGEKNIRFIRGRVADVRTHNIENSENNLENSDSSANSLKNQNLLVRVEDTLGGGLMDIETNMVGLSCALEPSPSITGLEQVLGITLTPEMFVKEKNPKMEPTLTTMPGIFVCGTAREAMDITSAINMSRSAVSQVGELLGPGEMVLEPEFASVNPDKCNLCKECLKCPADAVKIMENAHIGPGACKSCGYCVTLCENKAIELPGYTDEEIMARIAGILDDSDRSSILAFLDDKIAYVAADNAGLNQAQYPPEVRIIKISSILRLESKHLLFAFEKGAKGIFLGDGLGHALGVKFSQTLVEKVKELTKDLQKEGIGSERIMFYEAYLPHYKGLVNKFKDFKTLLDENN